MPRGFNNWRASQVIRFLKKHGFIHSYTRGSHFYYIGEVNGRKHQVTISFHAGDSVHPKTMKSKAKGGTRGETAFVALSSWWELNPPLRSLAEESTTLFHPQELAQTMHVDGCTVSSQACR